jgi:hypothetical protein
MNAVSWISPFPALLISHAIKQHPGTITIISPKDSKVADYLRVIGFPLGRSGRGGTYCPIQHFTANAQEAVDDIYTIIDETFPQTAREGSAIKYIISELCDNIDQHASATQAAVIAQKYGAKSIIAIGVVDNGISIPGSFTANGIPFDNDADAIRKAVSGVSTKKETGRGYGLPSSLKIVTEGLGGSVLICSGRGALVTGTDADKLYILENDVFNGTVVYCLFGTPSKPLPIEEYT